MYPVNFTEKMSVNLTHAHTVCTRPSLSQREGTGDEARAHKTRFWLADLYVVALCIVATPVQS